MYNTEALIHLKNALDGISKAQSIDYSDISQVRHAFMPAATLGGQHAENNRLAMDAHLCSAGVYDMIGHTYGFSGEMLNIDGAKGVQFLGYPLLAILTQNPLMQRIIEPLTSEMLRCWVELRGDNTSRTKELTELVNEKYKVKELFGQASLLTSAQGGCMLFIDTGEDDSELELPLTYDDKSVPKGKLRGFRIIEPLATYPAPYPAVFPHKPNYFQPEHYYLQGGVKVHRSRLIKFSSGELPVLLRPAYNFYGLPMIQMLLPYVYNFERSRNAGVHIVDNFSLLGLKANLSQLLSSGNGDDCGTSLNPAQVADDLIYRMQVMRESKLNYGVALVDMDDEDFFQINTPLTGLEGMISLNLELLSLISKNPVTQLFGTPPRGFNATGEADRLNWGNTVTGYLDTLIIPRFNIVFKLIQLSEYGFVDKGITAFWPNAIQPTEQEQVSMNLQKAQTAQTLVESDIIHTEEARRSLQQDEQSGFNFIEPSDVPEQDTGDIEYLEGLNKGLIDGEKEEHAFS